jgi:hypothetical protein
VLLQPAPKVYAQIVGVDRAHLAISGYAKHSPGNQLVKVREERCFIDS